MKATAQKWSPIDSDGGLQGSTGLDIPTDGRGWTGINTFPNFSMNIEFANMVPGEKLKSHILLDLSCIEGLTMSQVIFVLLNWTHTPLL